MSITPALDEIEKLAREAPPGPWATWKPDGKDEYPEANRIDEVVATLKAPSTWPWSPRWWKPKNRRRDLIRAGALIVAEIERLDRAAQDAKETKP